MRSHDTNGRPAMTWVVVKGADGRTHLEARWSTNAQTHVATTHAA